ncbi:Multifunctional virulence effector protein DrrA [Tulasnella sp. 330]|nr:Multifunctional virulence effector protein DrrA [Tulasnella sp. 330]
MPCTAPTAGVHYETRFRFAGEEQWEQHFWDLSGNQLYDDLTCKYYNNVHHLWLFYDVTDRKSFDNIRQWVARARQLCPRFSSARIIGNKSDLHDKRAVSIEQAKALAQELGITWAGEVSAKTNQGVQMTFGSWGPVSRKLCARP